MQIIFWKADPFIIFRLRLLKSGDPVWLAISTIMKDLGFYCGVIWEILILWWEFLYEQRISHDCPTPIFFSPHFLAYSPTSMTLPSRPLSPLPIFLSFFFSFFLSFPRPLYPSGESNCYQIVNIVTYHSLPSMGSMQCYSPFQPIIWNSFFSVHIHHRG